MGLAKNRVNYIKGAVCRIDTVELGIAVQIQNIGEGFFHQPPPPQTWRTRRMPD